MTDNKVLVPPMYYRPEDEPKSLKVFFGGTIDNGSSIDWQKTLAEELMACETKRPLCIFNPRRANWDKQADKKKIEGQIVWELTHLELADVIVMNILPNSKSPISLMEIGLFARKHKLIVFCNENFYRYDNVKVVCERYDVPLYNTNDILVIKNKILEFANRE
jgi:hypothetical protein